MRAQGKLVFLLLGILAILCFQVFAVPDNDTVNITLHINTAPNVTFVELDDYNPASPADQIDLIAGYNKTVICNVSVYDYDGFNNINHSGTNVTIRFANNPDTTNKYYFQLVWNDTTAVGSKCHNLSVEGSPDYNGTVHYNCSVSMPYYAENGTWICTVRVRDYSANPLPANRSDTATVNELIALNISRDSIDFGYLAVGENTTNARYNATIENIGNIPIRVNVTAGWNYSNILDDTYGMQCNTSYINETDIRFDADGTFTPDIAGAGWTPLAPGLTTASAMTLNEANNEVTRAYSTIFWGLNLINTASLATQPQGLCWGWLFFDALRVA